MAKRRIQKGKVDIQGFPVKKRRKVRGHRKRGGGTAMPLILIALMIGGCRQRVDITYTEPNGACFEYHRRGPQQVGEVLVELPDGTQFLMDGQKSVQPPVTLTLPYGFTVESGKPKGE